MSKISGPKWHSLPSEKIYELLGTNKETGLSSEEVHNRIIKYGPNVIKKKKKKSPLVRFIIQFHNPLLYVLLTASLVTAFLREWVDSSVIFTVVFINAVIGYIQETKAEKAIIAMGLNGTEVAKEASDMILMDDNFATIVAAAEEGRSVFNNLMKCIVWTLPTNGGEAFTAAGTVSLFLWNCCVKHMELSHAQTIAVATLVFYEIFYLFNCRSLTRTVFKIGIFSNRIFWIGILIMVTAQLGFTYLPIMNTLFRSLPMRFTDWAQVILITFPVYFIVEFEKWIIGKKAFFGKVMYPSRYQRN